MKLTNLSKKYFANTRLPSIKFMGNRNIQLLKKEEKEDIKANNESKGKVNFINKHQLPYRSKSYFDFLENFEKTKSDFDIYRQSISEEDMRNVNYIEYIVDDWRNIKL